MNGQRNALPLRPGALSLGLVAIALTSSACRTSGDDHLAVAGARVESRESALATLTRTGWVASASSTSGSNVPANAVDGSATTRWSTSGAQTGQFFQIDMLSPQVFSEVTLDAGTTSSNFPRAYQLNVSNDGTTWASVTTGTGTTALVTITVATQTARFIRINQTATNTTTWSIQEINVFGLALSRTGWVATASSTSGSNVAANALDGSATTRWSSAGAQTGQSFQVDMQSPQTFNQLTLDAGTTTTNFPRGYQVFVSSDGTNWGTAIATGTGTAAFISITFPSQRARFIKITQTATSATTWSIQELNIAGQPTVQTAQARTGWLATASSTSGSNIAANALDGSATTRWSTSGAQTGQFFQVDMLTTRTFNQIVLDAGTTTTNFPRAYQVQLSNNGTTFTTVTSGTGSAALVTINFPAQTARFIKINQTATNTTVWSIQEMTVSGQALSARGWLPTATSTGGTDVPVNALDGVASTRWSTAVAQANGQTFQVDMVTAQTFNQLTLDAGTSTGNFPRAYAVSVSNDGTNWGTPVATGTGSGPLVTVNFLTQTARFFRIVQTGTATNVWSIHELGVWRIVQPCDTVTCTASDVCHAVGACDPNAGGCSNPVVANPTTVACNDGNACTTTDRCTATGSCAGVTVVCTAQDACHAAGTCTNGVCSNPVVANPTTVACDDGNACTTTDRCTATGSCAGTEIIACPGDACRSAGTCNPSTGLCEGSTNVQDNTPCDDKNRCSLNDTCHAGTCTPGPTTNGCAAAGDTYYVPVVNLGSTQGASYAYDINNNGVVTGGDSHFASVWPPFAGGKTVGYVWTANGGMSRIPAPANTLLFPTAININGVVVGGTWGTNNRVFRFDPSTTMAEVPPAFLSGGATGINDAGQFTGGAVFDASGYNFYRAQGTTIEKFLSRPGDHGITSVAIDQLGNLFGYTVRADTTQTAAFRFTRANVFEYLNTLVPATSDWDVDPVLGGDFLRAANGTNGNQIVGYGSTGGTIRGFVLTPGASPGTGTIKKIPLPTTLGDGWVSPRDINQSGEVVGAVMDLSNFAAQRAFIWVDGTGTVDLNTLIDPLSGWSLRGAFGINDNRQVVGWGILNGVQRSFEMDLPSQSPCPVLDACHGPGVRDRRGSCSYPVVVDGTTCNDNNLCTQSDHCVAGACTGTPLTCPGDYCQTAGTCNTATGLCSGGAPANEGLSCDDGNRCTITATCRGGSCVPEDPATGCAAPTDTFYVPVVNLGSVQGASYASDINNSGEVIGVDARSTYFRHGGVGPLRATGFRWTPDGGRQPMPQPAGMAVYPQGISGSGVVAGSLWDFAAGGNRVFRQASSTDTQFTIPVQAGWATDINNLNVATGIGIFDATGYKMFRAGPGGVEILPIVAGDLNTQPNVIDDAGSLVGFTIRANRTVAAIRYTDMLGMQFLNQLVPAGSDWNLDPVINGDYLASGSGSNGVQIVGTGLTGNGLSRGFVMTPGADGAPGSGVIQQIGMMSKFPNDANRTVSPRAINQAGEVVGTVTDYSGIHDLNAFIWVDGTGIVDLNDLIDPASGWVLAGAYAINDHREVVGLGWINGEPRVNGQERAFKMTVPDLRPCPGADLCHTVGPRDLRTGRCPAPVLVSAIQSCGAGIVLRVDGVVDNGNGQLVAIFGYDNAASTSLHPTTNVVSIGGVPVTNPVPAPPSDFAPGSHPATFLPMFGTQQVISWTVDGQTVIAAASLPHVPVVPVPTPGTPVRSGRIQAETFDTVSSGFNTGTAVEQLTAGSNLLYRAVDFGSPGQFNRVQLNLLSPTGVDYFAVHLDSLGGQKVADLLALPTGNTYAVESATLSPNLWGVHDVYLTITGSENAGLDWFELTRAPTPGMVVVDPGPRPSAAPPPDLSALPAMAQDDAPANSVWLNLARNVVIQPQTAEGVSFSLKQPLSVVAHVDWKGGPGPVTLSILDSTAAPIAPAVARTFSDNAAMAQTSVLPPQTVIVSVRNNGTSPITTNLKVGAVSSSP